MWDPEAQLNPYQSHIATYDVHVHSMLQHQGKWLRYRQHGWVYFPMQIKRPYEMGLRMGRFRDFRDRALCYQVSVHYQEDPDWFDGLVTWAGLRQSKWNFQIDPGGRWSERDVRFSFSCPITAVEFKLRWSD